MEYEIEYNIDNMCYDISDDKYGFKRNGDDTEKNILTVIEDYTIVDV